MDPGFDKEKAAAGSDEVGHDTDCRHMFRALSGFLFSKRDGVVDTSDFVDQLAGGVYTGCKKGLAAFPAPDEQVKRGARIFINNCSSCHTVSPSGGIKVGPSLVDVLGRPIGSQSDFQAFAPGLRQSKGGYTYESDKDPNKKGYSEGIQRFIQKPSREAWDYVNGNFVPAKQMKEKTSMEQAVSTEEAIWTPSLLCKFVFDPQGTIPGNAMGKKHEVVNGEGDFVAAATSPKGMTIDKWCPALIAFLSHTQRFAGYTSPDAGSR
eukprot:CAMPEP_0197628424 /NCGR_PEP_ID=MMETSP1338-20131121/6747_1 /TAXON_ID=43686 ORGANISM="Pelagodinium beii, Strain RCC1491" /NCGR_SAMPLE_ID=MMETSP1338 /ASSEMBLY_ACC=CAM_ASM_000754 /LENGTH=263 /DNA_ID=CAMNT_0043199405 /DNA_START=59 /DNA_END=850 /DNA_ORIENTATION=+